MKINCINRVLLLLSFLFAAATSSLSAQTFSSLWGDPANPTWDPQNSRLNDFTNVGYMNGNATIPDWPVGADVTNFGAVPDDDQDDSQAFIDALAACPPNHAVYVPNGRYVMLQRISMDKDYIVLRGEDMFETVLFYPKNSSEIYIEEVGHENPAYFSQGNGYRNTGGPEFIVIPGGTHRSIENLSIEFREQIKMGHWEHKGNDAIRHSGTHSWIRNLYIKNVDHGISTSGGQFITVRNIIFDQFIDRNKISIEVEGSKVGHMAMHLNDTDDNLYHNILMTGDFSHEFDMKRTVGVVVSDVKTKSNVIAYHGQGVKDNLYTNLETGDTAGQIGSDNPLNETYWGVYSDEGKYSFGGDLDTADAQYAYDLAARDHVYVGYDIDASILPTKTDTDFWYEAIEPSQLQPLNVYLAQLAEMGKPVPDSPALQAPNPYVGNVIRIKAVENNTVSSGSPDTVNDPLTRSLTIADNPHLKFDLTPLNLTSIHRVRLRLASTQIQNAPVELGVLSVLDDTWSADTLTYNNRPDPVELLDSVEINEDTQAIVLEFDVTAFVQDQWANDSSKLVSFSVDRLSGNGFLSGLTSIENGFSPMLIIEQVPSTVPGAPSAPTEVRATSLIGNIQLDWPDNPESDVVTYNVYRSYVSGDLTQYNFPIGMGLTTSDFVDMQDNHYGGWDVGMVRDDIPYFYRVTAVDAHGYESESSLEVIASAKGYADDSLPPSFNANPVLLSKATQYLPYSDSIAGSATDPEGDTLYYAKLNGPDWVEIAPDGTVTATPREGDTGTFQFTVVVSALNGGHDETTVVLTVDPSVPDAPQFTDILPADGSVELDWEHDAEGSSNFTFTVYRAPTPDGPFSEIASGLTTSSYVDSNLSNGTTGYYVVTASNAVGESPVSVVQSATPIAGFTVGTTYLGGGLITDPASWDNGLPIGQWGRIDVDASVDTSIQLDGYSILHTGGTINPSGISALTLVNGSQWITEGETASTAGSFRGFKVLSGSSFTLYKGTINTASGRDWVLSDTDSSIAIYGGTINLGRNLQVSGSAGPVFTIEGGTINGNPSSGYIGGNNFSSNAKTLNFNGGTTTAVSIDLSGANTIFHFGGNTNGSLSVSSIAGFGSNSSIDFLPGTRMALTVSSSATWAETAWNAGNLTYNGQDTSTLGSWAAVTAPDGLESGVQFEFDSGTGTLSISQAVPANQSPSFSIDPIERADALEGAAYTGSISGDATDPDNDTLTFSRLSGPAWLSVASNGDLSGTPSSGDTGLNSFLVQVSDGNGGSASATLEITVANINDAPAFNSNPIIGSDATQSEAYSGSLYGSALDADGDLLAYTKVGGPAWLNIDPIGTLSGTPTNGDVGLNTFTVEVDDGNGGIDTATLEITVVNVNDAPVFTSDPIAGSNATEEVAYSGTLAGTASDDDNDSLVFSKTGGPAWLSVSPSGILSGTPDNSDVGVNSFSVSVDDGNGGSDAATLTITVVNVNDAPVFNADPIVGANATENSIYTSSLAGTASDVDGDNLSYSKLSGPAWLSVSSNGDLFGTPGTGDLGLNTFTVRAADAFGGSDSATLEITVDEGLPPTAFTNVDVNDSLISNPGNWSDGLPTSGALGTIDINAQHDSSFSHDGYSVVHTDGVLTKIGFSGLKLGTGTIWEMNGANAQIASTRGLNLTGATFILNQGTADLTENNTDSSLNAASKLILNGGTMNIGRSIIFNDGDLTIDGGVLDVGSDMGSRNFNSGGVAAFNAGTVSAQYLTFGNDGFQVSFGGNTPGSLTIENFGGNRANTDLIDIDFAPGTQVTMQLTNPVESGVSGDGDLGWSKVGSETGLPWAEALWADGRLTYDGEDYTTLGSWATVTSTGLGDGYAFAYESATATLSLIVLETNDAPVFAADPFSAPDATEDAAYSGSIAGSASDADAGDTLSYTKTSGPAWLSIASNGDLSGTPANTDVGPNSFTVEVSDGNGGNDIATLEIEVINVNDLPVFTVDPIAESDATENVTYSGSIAGSATDEDAGDTLSYAKTAGPAWLTVAANGDLSGTPANADVGPNSFTVEVSDGNGGTASATLDITVINVNDAPVFTVDPIAAADATEDAAYTGSIAGSAIDVDSGDSLTYSLVSGPAWLSVAPNGELSGTPTNGNVGTNVFTVQATDNNLASASATLTIEVINVNDVPVFTVDPVAAADATEDAAYTGSIAGSATDEDAADTLSYAKTAGPAWLTVAANGDLSGTPANADVGPNSFTVEVSDGNGGTASATLDITVINVNDAPVFTVDPIAAADATEDAAYTGSIVGSATDEDAGDTLSYAKTAGPAWLTVAANGDLSGTPANEDVGPNSFTVEVSDGNGGTASATLEITVQEIVTSTLFTDADINDSLISTPGNWSNGLPTSGLTGTIDSDAQYDANVSHDGYDIVHTNGILSKSTGFIALTLGAGTTWEMNGANAQIASTRGLNLTDATFILNQGTADLTENNRDTNLNSTSELVVNGGTMSVGRSIIFNGGNLTVNDGSLSMSSDMGSRNFNSGGVAAFNGGTVSAQYLAFGNDGFQVSFGGTTPGSLTIENFGGNRANTNLIDIDFATGTQVTMQLTNPVESGVSGDGDLGWSKVGSETGLPWAEALWADGRLTYNGQDYTVLGSWATVTSTGLGDGNAFIYDSVTHTLSVGTADTTPPGDPVNLSATDKIGSVDLAWTANTEPDLSSYSVYRSETDGGPYSLIAQDLTTTTFTDNSVTDNVTYYYVLTALDNVGNESGYSNQATAHPGLVTEAPDSEIAVTGTLSGSIADLGLSDNSYQTLTEIDNGSTSLLEHVWVFNVTGAEVVTFYVEAHHTANTEGDNFVFAYSTDDVTYNEMLTVTKTVDDDTAQYFALPGGLSGTVYVMVQDTDTTNGNTQLDSLYIDELVIESETSSLAPSAALNPAPADATQDVAIDADLSWTAGLYATSHDVYFGTDPAPAFQGNQTGTTFDPGTLLEGTTYYWSIAEKNNTGTTQGPVWSFTTAQAGPKLSTGLIPNVGDSWQVVTLPYNYNSPVAVASVVLTDTTKDPVVARIRNASGNSLELMVQNPSGTAVSGYDVHLVVVEEGVYTVAEHGVDLEAMTLVSSGTNGKSDWANSAMEQVLPSNAYTNPVVFGQVMTANDAAWSVFWSSNGSRGNPASSSSIYVGKHVGEDGVTTRADETLGVLILESGNGTIDGVNYAVGVGGDSVRGVDNGPPFNYAINGLSTATHAAVSASAMDGVDGGWPVLYGANPVSSNNLDLAFDEDQVGDGERGHTSEQVSYLIFE